MAEAVVQHEIRGAKEIGNMVNKFKLFLKGFVHPLPKR
jgi:hypothetical protein